MKNTIFLSALGAVLIFSCASEAGDPAAPPGARSRGATLFSTHCTLCHGKDGALGMSGAKDLRMSSLSEDEMIALVTNGKGSMAPYKNVLNKSEIEAVVEHVRTLQATE
ncbi:MAG: cytochrome c [Flavobacteriales bacterium]